MRVIHINNSDKGGGSARAVVDISNALHRAGINSTILVQQKLSSYDHIHTTTKSFIQIIHFFLRYWFDFILISFFTKQTRGRFSFPFWGINLSKESFLKETDIIHLHWINQGYFSIKTFKKLARLNKPIVWTLHDMWAFTGGCHYSGGCEKFISECKNCPSLKFSSENDFSNKIFTNKILTYKKLNIDIVTCSKWLADEAKRSYLFQNKKITPIPNPIEIDIYKPMDQKTARAKLNLPQDKKLILFGTMTLKEKRKGFSYLKSALDFLDKEHPELKDEIEVLVFGSSKNSTIDRIPFNTNFVGRIADVNKLVQCYNSADLFAAPSLEDNLPNTVMESLSCGVPVVAFNIGGMPDMIGHKSNGYLAKPYSHQDFAEGLYWILTGTDKQKLQTNAREKVINNFTPDIIGKRYLDLYKSILN